MRYVQLSALAAVALIGLSVAAANAGTRLSFSPVSTKFRLAGSMLYFGPTSKFIQCSVKLTGSTHAKGAGSITKFDLGGVPDCKNIVASGLPWKLAPVGPMNAVVSNATLLSTQVGNCGGSFDLAVPTGGTSWSASSNMGACNITFSGAVTPPIKIVTR